MLSSVEGGGRETQGGRGATFSGGGVGGLECGVRVLIAGWECTLGGRRELGCVPTAGPGGQEAGRKILADLIPEGEQQPHRAPLEKSRESASCPRLSPASPGQTPSCSVMRRRAAGEQTLGPTGQCRVTPGALWVTCFGALAVPRVGNPMGGRQRGNQCPPLWSPWPRTAGRADGGEGQARAGSPEPQDSDASYSDGLQRSRRGGALSQVRTPRGAGAVSPSHHASELRRTRCPWGPQSLAPCSPSPPGGEHWLSPHLRALVPSGVLLRLDSGLVGFVLTWVSPGPVTCDKEGHPMASFCPKSEWCSDSSDSKSPTLGCGQGLRAVPPVCTERPARSCEGRTPSRLTGLPQAHHFIRPGGGGQAVAQARAVWPPSDPGGSKGFWGHCPGPGPSPRVPPAPVPSTCAAGPLLV